MDYNKILKKILLICLYINRVCSIIVNVQRKYTLTNFCCSIILILCPFIELVVELNKGPVLYRAFVVFKIKHKEYNHEIYWNYSSYRV